MRYSQLFVTSRGRSTSNVPNSCIESAEYIIQCIASGKLLTWASGASRSPNVLAYFGGHVTINISSTPDFHKRLCDSNRAKKVVKEICETWSVCLVSAYVTLNILINKCLLKKPSENCSPQLRAF